MPSRMSPTDIGWSGSGPVAALPALGRRRPVAGGATAPGSSAGVRRRHRLSLAAAPPGGGAEASPGPTRRPDDWAPPASARSTAFDGEDGLRRGQMPVQPARAADDRCTIGQTAGSSRVDGAVLGLPCGDLAARRRAPLRRGACPRDSLDRRPCSRQRRQVPWQIRPHGRTRAPVALDGGLCVGAQAQHGAPPPSDARSIAARRRTTDLRGCRRPRRDTPDLSSGRPWCSAASRHSVHSARTPCGAHAPTTAAPGGQRLQRRRGSPAAAGAPTARTVRRLANGRPPATGRVRTTGEIVLRSPARTDGAARSTSSGSAPGSRWMRRHAGPAAAEDELPVGDGRAGGTRLTTTSPPADAGSCEPRLTLRPRGAEGRSAEYPIGTPPSTTQWMGLNWCSTTRWLKLVHTAGGLGRQRPYRQPSIAAPGDACQIGAEDNPQAPPRRPDLSSPRRRRFGSPRRGGRRGNRRSGDEPCAAHNG